jgi:hypothetical protein
MKYWLDHICRFAKVTDRLRQREIHLMFAARYGCRNKWEFYAGKLEKSRRLTGYKIKAPWSAKEAI